MVIGEVEYDENEKTLWEGYLKKSGKSWKAAAFDLMDIVEERVRDSTDPAILKYRKALTGPKRRERRSSYTSFRMKPSIA